jgi:hypothetical protein
MFDEIQTEVAARLREHPYLATIDVMTEDKGDIEAGIRATLAKLGVAVTVMTVEADCDSPDSEPIGFGRISVIIEVAESVTANRAANGTGKPIGKICEAVFQAMSLHQSASRAYTIDKPSMAMVQPPPPATACRHLRFRTYGELPTMAAKPIT